MIKKSMQAVGSLRAAFAKFSFGLLLLVLMQFALPLSLCAADKPEREVTVFLVTGYDYLAGPSGEKPDIGRSLCATRCNAFSSDYLNYTEAGGWRMYKTAAKEQIRVPLNNPFLDGDCLCTADRYQVVVNELSFPDMNVMGEKIDPAQ